MSNNSTLFMNAVIMCMYICICICMYMYIIHTFQDLKCGEELHILATKHNIGLI